MAKISAKARKALKDYKPRFIDYVEGRLSVTEKHDLQQELLKAGATWTMIDRVQEEALIERKQKSGGADVRKAKA